MNEIRINRLTLLGMSALLALVMALGVNILFKQQIQRGYAQSIVVGLIITPSGLEDLSFNWMAYQGLLQAEDELGITGIVYTTTNDADYSIRLQECVTDGSDLCISIGLLAANATLEAAQLHPGTYFAVVDVGYQDYPNNLRGLTFASDEASYLAGILAGQMTKSNNIAAIGGMSIPPVDDYIFGYRTGAQCANPDVNVVITYTNDFANPTLGAQVAQTLIHQGADVIFAPAGGTGTGALLNASLLGAWVIGVDDDQFVTLFNDGMIPGSDKILTSVMKRIDHAVYQTIADVVEGAFSSGTMLYRLAEGGVELAPFHKADSSIPTSAKTEIALANQGIISGLLDPHLSCGHVTYLPCTLKGSSP